MVKTIIGNIKALGLGLNNAQERQKYLEAHKSEIVAYFKQYGSTKTVGNFHIGWGVLRRWRLIKPKQKLPAAKIKKSSRMLELEAKRSEIETYLKENSVRETSRKFHVDYRTLRKMGFRRERVKGGIISSIVTAPVEIERKIETLLPETDVGYLIAKGLIGRIETLEKVLTAANNKIKELEEQLAEKQEEIKKIIAEYNKALEKTRGIKQSITLAELKQAMGIGPDGTRRSFRE